MSAEDCEYTADEMMENTHTVSVPGAVNVTVMPCRGLVLDVRRVDGDTTSFLLRSPVNLAVVGKLRSTGICKHFGDGGGESGLSVIDVA